MSSKAIIDESLIDDSSPKKKGEIKVSALAKTTFREIKRSFGRFISILCLIALGVFAYVGISVTGSDMRYTGITYSNDYKLADVFIQSTYGLDTSDVDTITDFHDLRNVEYGYATDVTAINANVKDDYKIEDQITLKVESLPQTLSQYEVVVGRLPENTSEIILDNTLAKKYAIGDTINFIKTSTNDSSLNDLTRDNFIIVGFANSPEYLARRMRGVSVRGKGEITGFAGIASEVFKQDVYTIARAESTLRNRSETDTSVYDSQIKSQVAKLQDKMNDVAEKNTRFQDLQNKLQQKITAGEKELTQMKAFLGANDERVVRGEKEMAIARNQLARLERPTYVVSGRNDLVGYHAFFDNGERLDILAYIFPVFLFFIAVLVTSTTMKRMVEEQRPQIGALKSLGYQPVSIMQKYLVYGMIPGAIGTIIGVVFGLTLLPILIYSAYKTSYIFPRLMLRFSFFYVFVGVVIAMLCTMLPVIFAVHSSLKEKTIALMRPKVQKAGQRILLEKIPFIWHHMSFTAKVTARNIFRYKERMFMTVLGIAGSMALLIMGFGVRDSLTKTLDMQLNKIYQYDVITKFEPTSTSTELTAYDNVVHKNDAVANATKVIFDNGELSQVDTENKTLSIVVPQRPGELNEYVKLFDVDGADIEVDDTSLVLSDDTAQTLGLHIGDEIEIVQNNEAYHAKIGAINQWYFGNQVVLSPKYYETVFKKTPVYDAYFLKIANKEDISQVLFDLQNTGANMYASTLNATTDLARGTLDGLNLVMVVLLGLSSLLAVIVLYNLTNINISERIRELSTIKVLGFYPIEVTRYIYRETLILTLLGIVVGWFLGTALEQFVIIKIPPEQFMFYRKIFWTNYAVSSAIILVVAFIIMFVMHRKLKRVNMLDALKAVE